MPLKIIRGEQSAPLAPLHGKTVAVLGFGNQGRAHAMNLRDSGLEVVVGGRDGGSAIAAAQHAGFVCLNIQEAVKRSDLIIVALPDEVHAPVFRQSIGSNLASHQVLGFLHGFSVRFNLLQAPENVGVVLVAPKGPGATLRQRFEAGLGIPCLFAVHQENTDRSAEAIGLAWATGIGCSRAGIIYTTFKDETDSDLFGEQTVLCGGMTHLIIQAFEVLVEAGYPPELAYLECCHEVKQIADLVYEHGLAGMMERISNTAEFGAYRAGPHLIDHAVRARMMAILHKIESDEFANQMQSEHRAGFEAFKRQREMLRKHPIERAGKIIRELMTQRPNAFDRHGMATPRLSSPDQPDAERRTP